MSQGYTAGRDYNAIANLAASAFTWGSGYTVGRNFLNDGFVDAVAYGSSSTTSSPQTLVIDFGGTVTLVAFAVLNHNLRNLGAVTITIEAADNAAITTNAVTAKAATTVVNAAPNDRDTLLQFPSVTKRYWRLTFTHSGSARLSIGELLAVTTVVTLTRRDAYGWGEREQMFINRNEGRTGRVHATFVGGPLRTKRWPFREMQGTAEREELMSMWRLGQGGAQSLLWIESVESSATAATASSQECLFGKMQSSLGWTESDYRIFDVDALELVADGRGVGF